MTKKIALLVAHPDLPHSVANKALLEVAGDFKEVAIVDLYGVGSDRDLRLKAIADASAVIFQFPFYWASAPSSLKKWIDEEFTPLSKTDVIKNKPLLIVTTTASGTDTYRSGGCNGFTVDELLRPYQVMANHSGMSWQTPLVVYGMASPDAAENLERGVEEYRRKIESLLKK